MCVYGKKYIHLGTAKTFVDVWENLLELNMILL